MYDKILLLKNEIVSIKNSFTRYHITQWFSLLWSWLLTRLIFRNAKIVRLPIDLRNREYIRIGKNFIAGRYNRIECYKTDTYGEPNLFIGENVQINDKCHISCVKEIKIGNNSLIASDVFITDHDHSNLSGYIDNEIPWVDHKLFAKAVLIGSNVWIGEKVIILKGVEIGENSVIAAGSVVTKSFPKSSLIAGNPAKLLRQL